MRAAAAAGARRDVGSPIELFRDRRWRRNTLVGVFLGLSGMVGLWGIGFYSPELISTALQGAPAAVVSSVRAWGTAFQDMGAFAGMIVFTVVAAYVSRRAAFLGALLLGMVATIFVFKSLHTASDAYWMLPLLGFSQLMVFAGYSIYFPELFPTRLRGTGVGFCYNTVRYLAAPAPILFGYLTAMVSFRTAAMFMSSAYLIGVIALLWAPETKGRSLLEEA
jgi:MFS family permease